MAKAERNKTEHIGFRVEPALKAKMDAAAALDDRDRGSWIRHVCRTEADRAIAEHQGRERVNQKATGS